MRMVFFGTPAFALPSLKALLQSGEKVVAVVTRPDKRKGRRGILSPPPVKELAVGRGIKILQPVTLKDLSFLEDISKIAPDIIVVVAYGKILPAGILAL